jgi:hypothetical protein
MRLLAVLVLAATLPGQEGPNVRAQSEAMRKLAFLVGTWNGTASVITGPKGPVKVLQTEEVESKLGGLILTVQGTGREPATGEVYFRAFATIAYDDAGKAYRFRTYNDGRYLDTELKVGDKSFEWSYTAGPAIVRFTMHLNEAGDWVEKGEVTMNGNPPRQTFDMTVKRGAPLKGPG